MNVKQVLITGAIALASAGAFADDITIDKASSASLVSRDQVRADVLKARANGELLSAGEGYSGVPAAATSSVARSDIKGQVIAARAAGELQTAGEADPRSTAVLQVASTRSRADVKAEVIAARHAGELLPAGEAHAILSNARPPLSASTKEVIKSGVDLARGKQHSGT
jgi:Domain of unknown function (DUF4148)